MNAHQASNRTTSFARTVTTMLASERFFYVLVAVFIIQAAWFAITARYPMAFDEDFHFGLIKLHATQWLPFFTSQPKGANVFGPVVRDPSYLYHYLMSFPYRLISRISQQQSTQIIFLRFLNIGLATSCLILFRRLLQRLGGSRALTHTILLLFSLVPIVPFLAAHINYDNLFIVVLLCTLLITFDWLDDLKRRHLSFTRTTFLLVLLLLGSLVKYAFLPIAVGIGVVLLWQLYKYRSLLPQNIRFLLRQLRKGSRVGIIGLSLLALLSCGLFIERYGVNIIHYHAPNPDCARILDTAECLQYGPWNRDYTFALNKPSGYTPSRIGYIWQWVYGMWQRSFFAISDTYDSKPPLPVPSITVIVLAIIGGLLFLWYAKRIVFGNDYRQAALLTLCIYLIALFAQTFHSYLQTGQPVAINGRYLIPFLPLIFLFIGLAFQMAWQQAPRLKAFAVVTVFILFLQGGGVITFILDSDDSWDWSNPTVIQANDTARRIIKPLIIGAGSRS